MAMKRTIFEIPVELCNAASELIEEYPLVYQTSIMKEKGLAELTITHERSQDYIIDIIEQAINDMAMQMAS